MIDYRYHALSLAAVLLALALGVLLGVAIGDSNLVSSAKRGVVHTLQDELSDARGQIGREQQLLAEQQLAARSLYPLAVRELLAGRRIGLVFLGAGSSEVEGLVRTAVTDAGAQLSTVVALREPLELSALARALPAHRYAGLEASPAQLQSLGRVIGRELVSGAPAPASELLGHVRSILLSSFSGQLVHEDGLVVMRDQPAGMSAAETEDTDAFESGLLSGFSAAGVPATGVELTGTLPSQIGWYKGRGLSSVDDLDAITGQAALDYALAGYRGTYGSGTSAASLVPTLATPASQP